MYRVPSIRIARHLLLFQAPVLVYTVEFWLFRCMRLLSSSTGLCHNANLWSLLQRLSWAFQPHHRSLRVYDFLSICIITLSAGMCMKLTSSFLSSATIFFVNLCPCLVCVFRFQQERAFWNLCLYGTNHSHHQCHCRGQFSYCLHVLLWSVFFSVVPTAICLDISSVTFSVFFWSLVAVHQVLLVRLPLIQLWRADVNRLTEPFISTCEVLTANTIHACDRERSHLFAFQCRIVSIKTRY